MCLFIHCIEKLYEMLNNDGQNKNSGSVFFTY